MPPYGGSTVNIKVNDHPHYGVDWLDKCYEKVSFPNPKCETFLNEVNTELGRKIM